MKIEAKQRLMQVTAAPLNQASVNAFLTTLGLDPKQFGKAQLSYDKKFWIIPVGRSLTEDTYELTQAITNACGKPVISEDDSDYAVAVWNLKSKGIIAFDFHEGDLALMNSTGPSVIGVILSMFGDDARPKTFDVDPKAKNIYYEPYENRGRGLAKSLIKKLLKGFGMSDWTFTVDRGHWGA